MNIYSTVSQKLCAKSENAIVSPLLVLSRVHTVHLE